MRRIPVDTRNIRFFVTDPAADRTDNTGAPKTDRDGRPLVSVPVLVKVPDERSEVISVSVPGPAPKLDELTPVTFENLTAQAWSMNGRSGISFSADAVRPATGGGAAASK